VGISRQVSGEQKKEEKVKTEKRKGPKDQAGK
jgi:hypothetical protein